MICIGGLKILGNGNHGIRKYDDLRSAIIDIAIRFQNDCNDTTSPIYLSLLEDSPLYNIDANEYIKYVYSQKALDINNLPNTFYESVFIEADEDVDNEEDSDDVPPPLPTEEEISKEENSEVDDPSMETPPEEEIEEVPA